MIDAMNRVLAPLRRRVENMIARGVVRLVADGKKLQEVQVSVLRGETRENCERFQQYGFTSVPLAGAEAILLFVGGLRDHPLVVAVDDRRHRPTGLQPGEVALYTDEGDYILLKRGRIVEVVAGTALDVTAPEVVVHASTKVTLETPLVKATQDVQVGGNVTIDGNLAVGGTAQIAGAATLAGGATIGGIDFGTHTHGGVQPGSGSTGGPQ